MTTFFSYSSPTNFGKPCDDKINNNGGSSSSFCGNKNGVYHDEMMMMMSHSTYSSAASSASTAPDMLDDSASEEVVAAAAAALSYSSPPEDLQRADSMPCISRNFSCPSPVQRSESYSSTSSSASQTASTTTFVAANGSSSSAVAAILERERRASMGSVLAGFKDSQHSLASVLYKRGASQALLKNVGKDCKDINSNSSSGRSSPDSQDDEVTAATQALRSECVQKQASAANTIFNLAMKKENQQRLVDAGAVECMIDLAVHSASREVHRFLAMCFCRLAQNGSLVPRMCLMDNFFNGLLILCKSPNGTIWRQASRTLSLCAVYGDVDRVLDAGALPFIKKLANADQVEFQVDALRALDKITSGYFADALAEAEFWETTMKIAEESSVPCITQLAIDIMLNLCKTGSPHHRNFVHSSVVVQSVGTLQSLSTKTGFIADKSLNQLLQLVAIPLSPK